LNLNLFSRALKERWIGSLTFAAGLFLYSFLIVWIMPTILKNPEFAQLFEQYPKEVLALVAGGGVEVKDIFTVEGYLSMEYLALWWIIIIAGFAITFASGVVAKEVDEGTIEFLATQPLGRSSIIISRLLALSVHLIILIVVSLGSIGLLAPLYDVKIKTAGLFGVGFVGLIFLLAISAYTLFFSVIFKGRGKAVIYSVTLFIVAHLLNALAAFNETIEKFRFLSFFHYYHPYEILKTGDIPWSDVGVFSAIVAICIILSLLIFRRKDIAVS